MECELSAGFLPQFHCPRFQWAAARRQGGAHRLGVKLVFIINSSNEGQLGNNAYTLNSSRM
ncbi:hypothetical protein HaLaN_28777 [Haematococcus lacustris]|uniref:Uncharacterized protein n=1 Tax=Haematococcus lacustris TaxID=44745 RepID=A0A6A0AAZ5_HAELA|nr:hypothetical protein HaLaN_28777 [Haematococcus lacustris]